MNKKRLTIFISGILVTGAIVVAAENVTGIISDINEEKTYAHQSELIKAEMSVTVDEKTNKLKDKASKYDFAELLRSKGYYEDEVNDIVYRFIQLQAVYSLSDDETKEFYKLTKQDYDLEKLMDIFEYTINTDSFRDMKFVKEIYQKAQDMKIQSSYWVEIAFDALTGRTESALTQAQVAGYVNDGLAVEEIYAANIMSKRSDKTIEKIIKDKNSGKKWIDIADEIYPEIANIQNEDVEDDVIKIVSSVMKSKVTGLQTESIISDAAEAESMIANAQKAAETAANSFGFSGDELTESILSFAQEKLPDVDRESLAKWINKGHSVRTIEKKFKESKADGIPLSQKMNGMEVE